MAINDRRKRTWISQIFSLRVSDILSLKSLAGRFPPRSLPLSFSFSYFYGLYPFHLWGISQRHIAPDSHSPFPLSRRPSDAKLDNSHWSQYSGLFPLHTQWKRDVVYENVNAIIAPCILCKIRYDSRPGVRRARIFSCRAIREILPDDVTRTRISNIR